MSQINGGDLRGRIATQERPRFLGVAWPWMSPTYYDATTFRRDLERIERYYRAQGYYSAAVQAVRVERDDAGRQVEIDIALREGPPTRVATVWLSGCEPASRLAAIPDALCRRIRARMRLRLGAVFAESAFDADRERIVNILKEAGHAVARVHSRATVDPATQRAHVVYVLDPGPQARFGDVRVYESGAETPVRGDELPQSGLPVRPVRFAIDIDRGQRYTRSALATAQRQLFALGVFGIVDLREVPHRCDSRDRCDALRDTTDPNQHVVVDLEVRVSPANRTRARFGIGAEIDQLRSNVHGLVNFEHRNFLGGMRQLRAEVRPLLFLPFSFGGGSTQGFEPGIIASAEVRHPQLWRDGTAVVSLLGDIGPDPINPGHTSRLALRGAVGAIHQFDRTLSLSGYVRGTAVTFYNQDPILALDPIFREQYIAQAYAYLEQQLTWDRRDNPLTPRRGFFASLLTQEGAQPVGAFTFLRAAVEFRGYYNLGSGFVFAARGMVGAAIGARPAGQQWPVPQELRFFSGGANSNRGYPFNRVGYTTTVPEQTCQLPTGRSNPRFPAECDVAVAGPPFAVVRDDANVLPVPDERRVTAVGGLTGWEFSAELRWYSGVFGLVAFFDASDVAGWTPGLIRTPGQGDRFDIPRRPNVLVGNPALDGPIPLPPAPQQLVFGTDLHPSAGLGLRYVSPVGVIRLDVGLRLDDLGCGTFNAEVAAQNANGPVGSTPPRGAPAPLYYATSRPQCDVFGLAIPAAFHFAIGEAF